MGGESSAFNLAVSSEIILLEIIKQYPAHTVVEWIIRMKVVFQFNGFKNQTTTVFSIFSFYL